MLTYQEALVFADQCGYLLDYDEHINFQNELLTAESDHLFGWPFDLKSLARRNIISNLVQHIDNMLITPKFVCLDDESIKLLWRANDYLDIKYGDDLADFHIHFFKYLDTITFADFKLTYPEYSYNSQLKQRYFDLFPENSNETNEQSTPSNYELFTVKNFSSKHPTYYMVYPFENNEISGFGPDIITKIGMLLYEGGEGSERQ